MFTQSGDLAVSIQKMAVEAAQVGAGAEREDQRMEESAESLKPGKVVPTGSVLRAGLGGKDSGRGVWWCEELSRRRDRSYGVLPILTRKLLRKEQKP